MEGFPREMAQRPGTELLKGSYYIETYGCQMNEHDSEKIAQLLEDQGLCPVDTAEMADIIVINTCAIREKPEHKVYSALGKLRALKQRKPDLISIVAGCVAQQQKQELLKRTDVLDCVLGTHAISELPALISRIRRERRRVCETEFRRDVTSLHMSAPRKGASSVCSYVTIMQGCSNFCTYCVVPYTRGPEQSRQAIEIINEVKQLARTGVREITLLGQNVNAYGKDLKDGVRFPELLRQLSHIDGIARVRFTTSHPRDFHEDLAAAMRDVEAVCEHVHLPLQAGSNRILGEMRRGYTYEEYLEKIRFLREMVPHIAVTTDIIVGFPGETSEDFETTCQALQTIRFDQIFSFKYSPRPQTVAESMKDHLSEGDKKLRLARVHDIQSAITQQYHTDTVGSVEEVLIEGIRTATGQSFGRTRTGKIVNLEVSENVFIGDLIQVKITKGLKHSLVGKKI
jgi:tRNA-2-methylthio-N6-dimethylallyladenosine synthase